MGLDRVFAGRAGVNARRALVSAAAPPFGDGYDYAAGNALRLGGQDTPAQAWKLAAIFRETA
jgi:hypothetical protein